MSLEQSLLNALVTTTTTTIPQGKLAEELIRAVKDFRKEDSNKLFELERKFSDSHFKRFLTKDESVQKLIESFKGGNLVLVLGAGVSLDYGLPSWTNLLQKLIIKSIDNGNNEDKARNKIAAQLFDSVFGPNPLIAARYLHNHFRELEIKQKKSNLFDAAIQECMYEDLDKNKSSDLMQEIVKLCLKRGAIKRIKSVISYNYDDILEKSIENLKMDFDYKSIYKTGSNPSHDDLPIYHVHGFLPRTGKITEDNKVTLSDNKYHTQYSDIYGWSNLVQINNFKENNCLFIGVSFTDPNQRRLLDIAKDQRGSDSIQHFMLKRKYNPEEIETVINKILKVNDEILDEKIKAKIGLNELSKFLVDMVHNFETNDANSFGVEIIWVDDYPDYPEILKEIRLKSKD